MKVRLLRQQLFQMPPPGYKERFFPAGAVIDVPSEDADRMVAVEEAEAVAVDGDPEPKKKGKGKA